MCLFRGPGLQHLVPTDAEVALFLVFTVPYCWNVTFGTLAVIRHMLIIVPTYNDIDNVVIMREKGKIGSWGEKAWNSTEWEASQDANIESLWCSPFITSFLEVKTHQLFSSCQRKKQELRQSLFLTLARMECKHRNKTTWIYIHIYIYELHYRSAVFFLICNCMLFYYSSFWKARPPGLGLCFQRCQMVHWPSSSPLESVVLPEQLKYLKLVCSSWVFSAEALINFCQNLKGWIQSTVILRFFI